MNNNKPLISAVINVRNEADNLQKCLRSLKGFADEVIVVDMHSTDDSATIAAASGATVYPYKPMNYVEPARNFGLGKTSGKWIVLLDPDEYLTKELKKELLKVTRRTDIDFVRIPRKNIIFNKWIRHSKFWPDYLIRFFKKNSVTWKKEIHSIPETHGNGLTLLDSEVLAIRHNNYPTVTDFIFRALRYSNIQAQELIEADYKLKTSDLILKPMQEFNSRFYASEGYKDGLHGLILCLLQAFAIALVYIRIWEKQSSLTDKPLSKDSFVAASQETIYEHSYWFTKFYFEEYSPNIFQKIIIRFRHILDRISKNF